MTTATKLTEHHDLPGGEQVRGVVDTDQGTIPYILDVPYSPVTDKVVVVETGLGAGPSSLDTASARFTEAGQGVLRVYHKHRGIQRPFINNAREIIDTVHAVVDEQPLDLVGLSRGSVNHFRVADQIAPQVDTLTAVAPALLSPLELKRVVNFPIEFAREAIRNPKNLGSIAVGSLIAVVERLDVTVAEALILIRGLAVTASIERAKQLRDNYPHISMHLIALKNDGFYSPKGLEEAARAIGFNTYSLFSNGTAGHCALAYNPHIVDQIMRNNKVIAS